MFLLKRVCALQNNIVHDFFVHLYFSVDYTCYFISCKTIMKFLPLQPSGCIQFEVQKTKAIKISTQECLAGQKSVTKFTTGKIFSQNCNWNKNWCAISIVRHWPEKGRKNSRILRIWDVLSSSLVTPSHSSTTPLLRNLNLGSCLYKYVQTSFDLTECLLYFWRWVIWRIFISIGIFCWCFSPGNKTQVGF